MKPERDPLAHLGAEEVVARAPVLAAGSRWGPLEVGERVGGGAFGEVYRARDPRLDREVALRVFAPEASDPREEVIREARLLARVHHPNVVLVHGADRIDGRVGIWTEFLRGQTLDRILQERGALDGREAALIGIDLSRALAAVHASGILHQDLKLSNVMRTEDGRIVLMDFGLGREIEALRRPEGSGWKLLGTPLFMAPEVLNGARPDSRSDLYSLGVVLFALVTGSLPVEAPTLDELRAKHANRAKPHPRDLRPDLSDAIVDVLERALSLDPQSRFQKAGDVEHALLASLGAVPWDGPEAKEREARAAVRVQHRLPAEVDSFVGREVELARLAERFRGGTRLVTLQGPGGIGKTRLANRYGWRSLEEWPGGAWFCDLTEARSRDGIASAVAEGLGVTLGAGDPVAQLSHAIATRGPCLVILDNFEQVVRHAAETVAPWLASAPEVRILATSRERLELRGEEVEVIEALPIERGVELFVERARRQRTIELDGPEGASVREVVRLLEGIPLAIELSVGRLRVMTPAQIVERIAERFRILAGTGAGRHATLRAAIDGSWELLQPWEKAAFAQCAVFEGGFGLEAAETVLDLHAWPDAPWVTDVLQSLVDKSLIRSWMPRGRSAAPTAPRPVAQPAMRFGMFVSLQEYAREKLAGEGAIPADGSGIDAATATERRHGQWFARFGQEHAIDALDREGGVERRQALATELDNLMAACRRTTALGDGQAAVGSYRAAWAVIELQGPLTAAVEMGTQVLRAFRGRGHDSLAAEEQAQLLHTLGRAKQRAGRLEDARADLEASLAIDRKRGDRQGEGRTLAILATLPLNNGRLEEARAQLESALVIHREVGDRRAEGIALGNLGLAHHEQGRLEDASVQLEAALSIHREIGNRRSEGIVRGNLGNLRREQGRMEEARIDFEAALAIHREVGNRRFEAIVLGNLGSLYRNLGRWEEARTRFAEALAIHREVGARRFEGEALDNLANVSLAQGAMEDAGTLYAAALAIHREVGNRRAEGIVLISLSALRLEQGRLTEARELLSQGDVVLASAQVEARPDSELGRRLTTLRKSLMSA